MFCDWMLIRFVVFCLVILVVVSLVIFVMLVNFRFVLFLGVDGCVDVGEGEVMV